MTIGDVVKLLHLAAGARLRFIAVCAGGCGTPVPADRVMCPVCAWS